MPIWLLNPRVIISIIVLALCLGGYLYVGALKTAIEDRDKNIVVLQEQIKTQNDAINSAGNQKVSLDQRVRNIEISNGRLQKENQRLNDIINGRVPAKTCEEAYTRVLNNASSLAKSWNTK